jgi:predicted GIY-YIG superfamily endonuclease
MGLCFARIPGRHYIGSTVDLDARIAQHRRGHTHTTKRLGENLELVASKSVGTLTEARKIERILKAKKNPQLAIHYLQWQSSPESFRGWSGVRISPPGTFQLPIVDCRLRIDWALNVRCSALDIF